MAKNFTDFQQITGAYVAPDPVDGVTPGVTTTQATTGMHLVGYELDEPHGERRYTVESVLLAADKYHVGLENVTNESKEYMFNDSTFTGRTSADNIYIHGDLHVEGNTVQLNTTTMATSAMKIENHGTLPGITVIQYGPQPIARFLDGEDVAMDINQVGHVGIGVEASTDTTLTVLGDVSANGEVYTTGAINGRYLQQDGAKLDNLQPWADVTSLNLSDVSTRLSFLKDNAPEHANITVGKGLDLLEDGDDFKKTPTSLTQNAPAIGDYSIEKLQSVEYQADVTGDHSADIIFNQVPDGPYTGDVNTTFVKITSGEHDRLTSIRGVQQDLYTGDDGADISEQHIAAAYHTAYPDFWSTADETEYRDDIIPRLNSVNTSVFDTSANWNYAHTKVAASEDNWDSTHVSVNNTSANWDSTHTSVYETSANWDTVYTDVSETSANWDSTHTSVYETSANWDFAHQVIDARNQVWDDTSLAVFTGSATWEASVNNIDDFPLPAGVANLIETTTQQLNVTESLTAQDEVRLGGEVFVLSAGQWKPGITATVPLGNDLLYFVDGILVEWDQNAL